MKKILLLSLSLIAIYTSQIKSRTITIENRSSKPLSTGLSYNFSGSNDPFTDSFANNLDVNKIVSFKSGLLDNEVSYNLDATRSFKLSACTDDTCKNSTAYLVVLDDKICEDTSKELQPVEITITDPKMTYNANTKVLRSEADGHTLLGSVIFKLTIKFTEERSCTKEDRTEIITADYGDFDRNLSRQKYGAVSKTLLVAPNESLTLSIQKEVANGGDYNHMMKIKDSFAPKTKTYDPYVLNDLKPGQKVHLIVGDSDIKEATS